MIMLLPLRVKLLFVSNKNLRFFFFFFFFFFYRESTKFIRTYDFYLCSKFLNDYGFETNQLFTKYARCLGKLYIVPSFSQIKEILNLVHLCVRQTSSIYLTSLCLCFQWCFLFPIREPGNGKSTFSSVL